MGALEGGARRESSINVSDEHVWRRSFRNPDDLRILSGVRERGQVAKDDEVGVRCRRAQGVDEIGYPSDVVSHELEHPTVDLAGFRVISDQEDSGRWTADCHRGAIILANGPPPARSFGPLCVSVQPPTGTGVCERNFRVAPQKYPQ